jgi:hypothetical protein
MPRKKKESPPSGEPSAETLPEAIHGESGDPTPVTELNPLAVESPEPASGGDEPAKRQWAVGPQWFKSASLGDERGAPKMDLGRDHKYKQLAIRFPERPEPEVIDALHEAGWTWRGKERYWTKQIDAEKPASSQQAAEEFFEKLADGMRARRGLGESPAVA